MLIPDSIKDRGRFALNVIEDCRVSQGTRQALAQYQTILIESGKTNGQRALVNKLVGHCDRLASYLFSPTSLRFHVSFERHHSKEILSWAAMAARVLTKEWKRKDSDLTFGLGVEVAVKFGASIFKLNNGHDGITGRVLMPWQFGVYSEDINGLGEQEAVCETGSMTLHEAWRRIQNLPDAEKLYKRICTNASEGSSADTPNTFFHQIVSSSVLNTNGISSPVPPGGVVSLGAGAGSAFVGAETRARTVKYHQLYVRDDDFDDYTTFLIIEPDILVTPLYKRSNLWAPKTLPYTLIQPNITPGYFWGRSEVADLEEPQILLATWFDDIRRVIGCQYDKLIAFSGYDGITDERYAQMRGQGYLDGPPGSSVNDLTPKLPGEALQAIDLLIRQMEEMAGFGNILSGQGEPGVRAGNHAESMIRTASPRLRDRSLIIERQCADAADKMFAKMRVIDGDKYTTAHEDGADSKSSEFLLEHLPDDWEIEVDSHSSSPVYEQDHKDMIGFGLKSGFIDGHSAIELLPFPNKDMLQARFQTIENNKAKQEQMRIQMAQQHPETAGKLLSVGKK